MKVPFLSKPLNIYKDSYMAALEEFQREGLNLIYDKSELCKDFDKFINELINLEKKPDIVKGHVKESIYWLIDGEKFIGRISIRHTLNAYLSKYDGNIGFEIRPSERKNGYGNIILSLGLKEAKNIGLKEVFIMCNNLNLASKKIIEKNNGILVDKYILIIEGKHQYIRKYKIDL